MPAQAALAEATGDFGERMHVDDAGADLGELALGTVGVTLVEPLGHHHTEHRVAQEFQTFIGGQATVFIRVGPVRQREREQVW